MVSLQVLYWTLGQSSVADPGCLSRILIFCSSDPGSNNNKKYDEKKINLMSYPFYSHHYIHKIVNYLIFWTGAGKNYSQLTKKLFYSRKVTKLSEKTGCFRLPRSWNRKKLIPDPGGLKSTGSWIRNTGRRLMGYNPGCGCCHTHDLTTWQDPTKLN